MKKKLEVEDLMPGANEGRIGEIKAIRKFSRIVRLPSGDSIVKELGGMKT